MLERALRFYKYLISPLFGDVCRFEPSCSEYAVRAIQSHGVIRGTGLAVWRVLRCNPWCRGGEDPVPERCKR